MAHRGSIVGLPKISIDSTSGCDVHNPTILLLHHMRPRRFHDFVCPTQMNIHHRKPQIVRHVGECLIPEYACIVDNNVDSTEGSYHGIYDNGAVFNAYRIRNSFASCIADLIDYSLSAAKIVDYYLCTETSEEQCVCPTEPFTGFIQVSLLVTATNRFLRTSSHEGHLARKVNRIALRIRWQFLCFFKKGHGICHLLHVSNWLGAH